MTSNPQENSESPGIRDFFDTDIYYSVAEDLLRGIIPEDPKITLDLSLYLKDGAYQVVDSSISSETDIHPEAVRQFIDRTKKELESNPVEFTGKLRTWIEIKSNPETVEITPDEVVVKGFISRRLEARKAKRQADEEARKAKEQRQREIVGLRHTTFNEKRMPVSEFKSDDQIILILRSWDASSYLVLEGRAVGHNTMQINRDALDNEPQDRVSGVSVEVTDYQRTIPKTTFKDGYNTATFIDDPLPVGSEILITESSYTSNDYTKMPGNLLQGGAPRIYWGGNRIRSGVARSEPAMITSRPDYLTIEELYINGLSMFPPVIRKGK